MFSLGRTERVVAGILKMVLLLKPEDRARAVLQPQGGEGNNGGEVWTG